MGWAGPGAAGAGAAGAGAAGAAGAEGAGAEGDGAEGDVAGVDAGELLLLGVWFVEVEHAPSTSTPAAIGANTIILIERFIVVRHAMGQLPNGGGAGAGFGLPRGAFPVMLQIKVLL
ncbi:MULTISPECIES: hypothetical protein [Gordonia]|uniref:hypothetical protein n=1 Tax=Gordonia TaxID=2053 RepID=UPI0025B80BAC|nr:hypothetical protein [Gordonia sp. UBA5067]